MRHLKKICSCLLMLTLVLQPLTVFAATPLWEQTLTQAQTWSQSTSYGTFLVGSSHKLTGLNPDDGTILWTRDDLPKTAPFNVREIEGTPILLINDYVAIGATTRVRALNLGTGEDIWQTEPENAYSIGVYPFPEAGVAVLFFNGTADKDEGNGVYMRAYELTTGTVKWQTKYSKLNAFPLHMADNSGSFFVKTDLSGQQDPLVEGDTLYVPFLGVSAYDINTGIQKWETPFKTGHKNYKKSYARPVIEGNTLYAAGEGLVYAIDKTNGTILWKSEHNMGFITQVLATDKTVFARLGGNFADSSGKTFKLVTPLGVLALDKTSGTTLWKYTGASGGITNIIHLPEQNSIMLADATRLIGLDVNETGKVKEAFSVPLKFKRAMNTAETAAVGVKALTGGLTGLIGGAAKAAIGKERRDIPIAVMKQNDGRVIVRGQQHIMSFNPAQQNIDWSVFYAAPGASAFMLTVMTALTAFDALANQYGAASGQMSSSSASNNITKSFARLDKFAERRFSASQSAMQYTYILTNVDDDGKKGIGLAAINMNDGETGKQIYLDNKNPEYTVDELEGRLFYFHGKKLQAYNLR
jgi:outer membrane protein assembly factor BamB